MPEAKTATAGATPPAPPAPPAETKIVPLRKVQKKIAEPDFMLNVAGSAYNFWIATVGVGVTEQDCQDPVFWHNVSKRLNPRDRIEVWAVDGSWFGEFRVIFADEREARLQKVHRADVDVNLTSNLGDDPEYTAEWVSPPVRYGVRRKADNVIVARNCNTLADAQLWIMKRRKTVG